MCFENYWNWQRPREVHHCRAEVGRRHRRVLIRLSLESAPPRPALISHRSMCKTEKGP